MNRTKFMQISKLNKLELIYNSDTEGQIAPKGLTISKHRGHEFCVLTYGNVDYHLFFAFGTVNNVQFYINTQALARRVSECPFIDAHGFTYLWNVAKFIETSRSLLPKATECTMINLTLGSTEHKKLRECML